MLPRTTSIWQRGSPSHASGRPGAVQADRPTTAGAAVLQKGGQLSPFKLLFRKPERGRSSGQSLHWLRYRPMGRAVSALKETPFDAPVNGGRWPYAHQRCELNSSVHQIIASTR